MIRTDITWTDTAWEHWANTRDQCTAIRMFYGDALGWEHEAELLRSFTRATFAAGAVNVQKDGDGFLITTPHIVMGLVWTPDSDDTMRKRIATSNTIYRDFTLIIDKIPADWPRTGRWSTHS